jgi:hypothetical protein
MRLLAINSADNQIRDDDADPLENAHKVKATVIGPLRCRGHRDHPDSP